MRLADSADRSNAPREASSIRGYRQAVEQLTVELESSGPDTVDAADALWRVVHDPKVLPLLTATPQGPTGVHASCLEAVASYQHRATSNASSPATLVRILLLQLIDIAWWASAPDFATDDDVTGSPDMVNLVTARARGHVDFAFKVGSDRFSRRIRNHAVHRLRPNREPRTSGLALPYLRPELLALLNEISMRLRKSVAGPRPALWVTSLTRSVAHQRHLQTLGYSAFLPSAHCRGWAADIEMQYLDRFHASGLLQRILVDYRDAGVLNVIDEGRVWHVCLSPDFTDHYRSAAQTAGFVSGLAR